MGPIDQTLLIFNLLCLQDNNCLGDFLVNLCTLYQVREQISNLNKRRMGIACVSKSCWEHSMENATHFYSEAATCFFKEVEMQVRFLAQ